jgi:hypothetical protein
VSTSGHVCEEDDSGAKPFAGQRARDKEPAASWHVDIEHGDIGLVLLDHGERALSVACFRNDTQAGIGLDHLSQTMPNDWMIVRQHDGDLLIHDSVPFDFRRDRNG